MKTAILTDTNSGIYAEEAEKLGIFVMPMPVIIEDETYYEGTNLTEEEFLDALTSGKRVTTSQPALGDLLDTWDELLNEYDQVVYIPMSSGLSNSCHAAMAMAEEYEGRVVVVDNHRISVTLRQSVLTAKAMAMEEKSAEEIKLFLEAEALRSSIYVSVNTLEYLKKGGRITPAAAMVGSVLKLHPKIVVEDGAMHSTKKYRGNIRSAVLSYTKDMEEDLRRAQPDRVFITHSGCAPEVVEPVRKYLESLGVFSEILETRAGGVVSSHCGPGTLGVLYIV